MTLDSCGGHEDLHGRVAYEGALVKCLLTQLHDV